MLSHRIGICLTLYATANMFSKMVSHFHQQCNQALVVPHSHQYLSWCSLFIGARGIPVYIKWCIIGL